ncbi:MAG: hypothetical protein AAGJ46_21840, partial [Planctomycetota bacterium]
IDIAVIGDSNAFWGDSFNGGFGHYKGLAYAAARRYGLYKTGTLPMNILAGSWNFSAWTDTNEDRGLIPGGSFTRYADGSGRSVNENAPAALHAYAVAPRQGNAAAFAGGGMPWGYLYGDDSASLSAVRLHRGPHWWKPGDATRPGLLDIDANLRYHLRYGTFETGSGSFAVSCMDWASDMPNSAGVNHAFTGDINPVTGSFGLADLALDIPAGARGDNGITIRPVRLAATTGGGTRKDLEGPFFGLWQCLENTDQATGVGVNVAGHFGSQTARHAADYFLGTDGSSAAGFNVRQAQQEYWRFTLATQRATLADAKLIVHLYFAENDINGVSTENSLGPSPAASNTKEGYADNHKAIVDRIRADLVTIGVTSSNVLFVCGPYAKNPNQSTATRNEWAAQLESTFADDDRVVVAYGEDLMQRAEIEANGGFDALAAHLTPEAYQSFATATLVSGEANLTEDLPTAAQFTALDTKTTSVQTTLGDLTEDNGGTQRLTAAALAEAPAGGGSATTYFTRFGTSSNARTAELLGVTHPTTVYASIADSDGDYYDFSAETFTTPGSGALGDLALAVVSTGEAQPPSLGIESYAAFALSAGDYTVIWRDGQSASDTVLATMPFYADGSRVWESRADAESSAVNTTLADGGEVREAIENVAVGGTVDAEVVPYDRTWRLTGESGSSKANEFVTVQDGYAGTLQVDYSRVLAASLTGTPTVTVSGPASVAPTNARRHATNQAVLFDVPALTTPGTYTVRVVVQTVDSQAIPTEATLIVT